MTFVHDLFLFMLNISPQLMQSNILYIDHFTNFKYILIFLKISLKFK